MLSTLVFHGKLLNSSDGNMHYFGIVKRAHFHFLLVELETLTIILLLMDEMTKYSFTIEQSALRIASPISGVGKIEPFSFCDCARTSNEIGLSSEINHYAHLALVVWTI